MIRQNPFRCHLGFKEPTLSPYFKFCASHLTVASLLALAIPSRPASAAVTDYQVCAAELLRANIAPELATQACAEALYPKDVSRCVLRISTVTPTISDQALAACRRVRRPVEMANCVFYISNRTQNSEVLSVIDNCRRSLLPVRFAECVIGLNRATDLSSARAMETCIGAVDYARDLAPTFVPPPPPNPTLPPNVPETIPNLNFTPVTPTPLTPILPDATTPTPSNP